MDFYTFLPKILNMSLTASVAIVFVLLLRLLLKKAPKVISYALWGVVLIRLLCPVAFESPFSLINTPDAAQQIEASAETYIEPTLTYTDNGGFTPDYDVLLNRGYTPNAQGEIVTNEAGTREAFQVKDLVRFASWIWLTGVVAMVIYSAVSYASLRRRLMVASPLRDNVYLADDIDSPFVMGLIRPKIYLPSAMEEREQSYIILHEQHHIRRLDHIVKALAFVALCVHWFNPLVWVAFVLSGKDMEMSCDEAVVRKLGTEIRADYSASLLSLATGKRIIAGMPLAFGEGNTKGRIKNLANWKKPAFWVVLVAIIACVVLAVCLLTNPKQDSFRIRITVPAGTTREMIYQEDFVYSDEEISPVGNKITISAGDGLGDTEVVLKPIEVKEENAYEPTYLTPGMPVTMDVEKGAWFKIGIKMQNPTEEDIIVYVEVDGIEVRIEDEVNSVLKWFDYTDDPSSMDDESTIKLPIYQDITFSYNRVQIAASRPFDDSEHSGQTILITGMPIWNAYFTDLTGDDYPEICATYSYGSGIIDNRVVIYDYVNGASYELSDRGYHDYTLRQDNQDGHLYVDKKQYNSDELVETGRLIFKDNCIQVEGFSNEAASVFQAEILEIHDGYYLVEPVEGSWELSSADRIEVPIRNAHPSPEPEVGDVIEIEYSGEILETYPARIANVYGIRVVEESEYTPEGTLHLGENAIVIDIDDGNCILYVRDIDKAASVFGDRCAIDCSEAIRNQNLMYVNYDGEGDVRNIRFEDFEIGDNIIIGLYDSEKQKAFNGSAIAEQIQLGTQRLNQPENKFYLTIGADNVKSIELSMPGSSGGCENADGSLFKKGEQIWLENLDGYSDLRGLTITAFTEDGEIIWTASIPNTEENRGFTRLTNDDWTITNIE